MIFEICLRKNIRVICKNIVLNCRIFRYTSSSFYWASVANAPNVLQPYWLVVLPLDVPDLTASLLL